MLTNWCVCVFIHKTYSVDLIFSVPVDTSHENDVGLSIRNRTKIWWVSSFVSLESLGSGDEIQHINVRCCQEFLVAMTTAKLLDSNLYLSPKTQHEVAQPEHNVDRLGLLQCKKPALNSALIQISRNLVYLYILSQLSNRFEILHRARQW